jgi:dihydrodipicolinate reductase
MNNAARRLKNKIATQEKLVNDLATGKYFSGAGFEVLVYKGKASYEKDPDYVIEVSSPEIAEKLVAFLIEANKESIETTKTFVKSDLKECQEAMESYNQMIQGEENNTLPKTQKMERGQNENSGTTTD